MGLNPNKDATVKEEVVEGVVEESGHFSLLFML